MAQLPKRRVRDEQVYVTGWGVGTLEASYGAPGEHKHDVRFSLSVGDRRSMHRTFTFDDADVRDVEDAPGADPNTSEPLIW